LVFCGPSGTGKSFLAAGLVSHEQDKETTFTTGADFARNFAHAIDTKSVPELRAKLIETPQLIIDDLESLGRRQAAQLELSIILDERQDAALPTIVICRQPPGLISSLCDRLISRLSAGLIASFQHPGLTSRRLLIKAFADLLHIDIDGPARQKLAEESPRASLHSALQLRHALVQLASETDGPLDESAVATFLAQFVKSRTPTLSSISNLVSHYFRLKVSDLRGPKRQQQVVRARGLAMYLARKYTNKSLAQLGDYFGGRDHTTVLHACRKTERLANSDRATQQALDDLHQQLTESDSA